MSVSKKEIILGALLLIVCSVLACAMSIGIIYTLYAQGLTLGFIWGMY